MSSVPAFTHTDPALLPILEDLRRREPIFHRPNFPTAMSSDYWEVGASGRRYTHAFILDHLTLNPPLDAATANWQITEPAIRSRPQPLPLHLHPPAGQPHHTPLHDMAQHSARLGGSLPPGHYSDFSGTRHAA